MRTNEERLKWLVSSGAMVAHSRDGEYCWLVWPYGNGMYDDDDLVKQGKGYDTPTDAIDAAMDGKDTGF